jgi:hypothetical protein
VGGEVVYCDVMPGVQASVKDQWSGLNLCPEVANVLAKHNSSQVEAALRAKSPFTQRLSSELARALQGPRAICCRALTSLRTLRRATFRKAAQRQ